MSLGPRGDPVAGAPTPQNKSVRDAFKEGSVGQRVSSIAADEKCTNFVRCLFGTILQTYLLAEDRLRQPGVPHPERPKTSWAMISVRANK